MPEVPQETGETGLEIAVIGMTGRFPGAENIAEFWENLKNGVESISFLSEKELEEAGVSPAVLQDPRYVKAISSLENSEYFDAAFFGHSPREAEVMDPQMRIFYECAYHALEDAGYDPYSYEKLIGCYAGASYNFYWQALVLLSGRRDAAGVFQARQLFDKEYLCTRAAHKLNLKGPAVSIQTACSTSLVAIHMACQGLISGECDMALAGGVSAPFLKKEGYLYQEGMILSSDGHCRAFDARADGTVFGNGIGVVVLKRLEEAMQDRDNIYAVIKGSFVNNDGMDRGGFTAPAAEGEAAVVRTALQIAEVEPDSIGYVEMHGTGTALGDPIEVEGLELAFNTGKKRFCAVGSVKSNMGHLNIAAGVTGFIKTVLALKHRLIPPGLHFESPNPAIDFENSPFYVNTVLSEWKNDHYPLRAGVSSFGIGGTNAHVVLEEAPPRDEMPSVSRDYQLILLSAKTGAALDRMTENLADYLKKNRDVPLADVSYTLMKGRKAFTHRRMVVCADENEAVKKLSAAAPGKAHSFFAKGEGRPVIFMFSGLGSQYVNMGKDLYRTEPVFREEMDRCFSILKSLTGTDFKKVLYPDDLVSKVSKDSPHSPEIHQPEISQPVMFIFEYALAKLLMNWGITPHAMIGYSFGEYAASCISGVLSLADALKLIVSRGELVEKIPPGAMLSVPMTREELEPLLSRHHRLSLAIDNGPSCIAAGPADAVNAFETEMKKNRCICMPIQAARALHSKMMEPILAEFEEKIAGEITLNEPKIPCISNLTGGWLTSADVTDPAYWARHLRETVRFSDGIKELMKVENAVFLEIGPGRDLATLLVRHIEDKPGLSTTHLVRHRDQNISDIYFLLSRVGRLWLWGVKIDWQAFYSFEKRYRVSLPKYPFEPTPFSIEKDMFERFEQMLAQSPLPAKRNRPEQDMTAAAENIPGVIENKTMGRRPDLETEYISPGNEMEQKIARTWVQFFGFERIGIDDDFFELGGDSLKALIVISEIHKALGVELTMNEFFTRPTIRNLALFAAEKSQSKEGQGDLEKYVEQPMVLLTPLTDKKLFGFPPALGYGMAYKTLSEVITDYSLYSFSFIEEEHRLSRYVDIITRHQPAGPYLLFGFSAAGKLTFEVAKALENNGLEVSGIILVDCFWPPDNRDVEVPKAALENMERYLDELGVGYLKEKITGKTKEYRKYFTNDRRPEKVNADVHLILSEENRDTPRAGCWDEYTTKTTGIYQGLGAHNEMLYTAVVEKNAEMIREILAGYYWQG